MVNVEERTSKYNKGICPDCNLKLEKTELGKDKPFLYCKKCNNSFEICGGQVMSQGDAIKRSNDKWREYRESCGDNEYGVGLEQVFDKEELLFFPSNKTNITENHLVLRQNNVWCRADCIENADKHINEIKQEFETGYFKKWYETDWYNTFLNNKKKLIPRQCSLIKEELKMAENTEFVVGNWYKRVYADWCNFKRGEIYKLIEIDPRYPAGGIFADVNNHIVNLKSQAGNYGYASLKRFVPVDSPFKTKDVCETESDMERLRREVIPYDCYGRRAHQESLGMAEAMEKHATKIKTDNKVAELVRNLCGPERTDGPTEELKR